MRPRAYGLAKRPRALILTAAKSQSLKTTNPTGDWAEAMQRLSLGVTGAPLVTEASYVSRAELMKFANAKGERPAFLFLPSAEGLRIEGPTMIPRPHDKHQLWRITVTNDRDQPSENVTLRLTAAEPAIRGLEAYLPAPVVRIGAPTDQQLQPCTINPKDSINYELLDGWISQEQEFFVAGLKSTEPNPGMKPLCLGKAPQEWELKYKLTASNAPSITFAIRLCIQGSETIFMKRID